MALTTAQQNKCVQLLGYGGKTLDPTSVIYSKIIADRLVGLNADAEALVTSYLLKIQRIETQIDQAPTRFISSQVGDIKINQDEIHMLRSERRVLVKELSDLLDIPYIRSGGKNVALVS
jgi:hypothetical protein